MLEGLSLFVFQYNLSNFSFLPVLFRSTDRINGLSNPKRPVWSPRIDTLTNA